MNIGIGDKGKILIILKTLFKSITYPPKKSTAKSTALGWPNECASPLHPGTSSKALYPPIPKAHQYRYPLCPYSRPEQPELGRTGAGTGDQHPRRRDPQYHR